MTKKLHSGSTFHHGKEFMNRFYNFKGYEPRRARDRFAQHKSNSSVAYMHHPIENIYFSGPKLKLASQTDFEIPILKIRKFI